MKKLLIFIFFLIFTSGCVTYYNPVTKKEEYTLYTVEDEIDMGKAIDKKIQREYKVLPIPKKIKKIGEKIAKFSDRPQLEYKFRIIKGKEINAFSIPGGFVYIYSGLLDKIDSDDEIACIIGHEIGHICARDGVHRLQKILIYSIPASILFSKGRYEAIERSVNIIFNLTMLKYSREEELRADRLGVTYAFKAGYDPEGMIRFFEKLKEMKKGSFKLPAFLRDHPDVEERIKNVKKTIEKLKEGNKWKN